MANLPGTHYVISAVLTDTGAPTYLTASGAWSPSLQEAELLADDASRDDRLQRAQAQERLVCDPYDIRVAVVDGKIDPLNTRERIRAEGPTTRVRRPD